ncbi:toprim domain-containing protein [Geminicoccus harenae]|uniref:toprim domain-containing protein n=1 Tax=Geminicoccus harenae TaxID=2498453 RepID=UPI00168A48F0|nr:toprim domain-containing protein [Geminicoccus harenae]
MITMKKEAGRHSLPPNERRTPHITAEDIAHAFSGHRTGRGWICCCPAHKDRTPSLSVADGDNGRPVLKCWSGCTFEQVRTALAAKGLWPDRLVTCDRQELDRRRREREAREEAENLRREVEAASVWDRARPILPGALADRYLQSRGFRPPWPPSLRQGFHHSSSGRKWPALVAGACRYRGHQIAAVQITPLAAPGRKAWTRPARITSGCLPGAAVILRPWLDGQRIVVVEGIEDGLAVAAACPDVSVVAVLGAANAATVQLPPRAPITLCLDGDDAGRKAAALAAKRLEERGYEVWIADLPDGADPASLLVETRQ